MLETVLINNVDEDACGAGEASITVVTAAIGNAIFDATGARRAPGAVHAGTRQGCAC